MSYTYFLGGKSGTKKDGKRILKDIRRYIGVIRKEYKNVTKDLPELIKSPLTNGLSFYLNAKKKIKDVYIIQYGQRDRVSLKRYDGTEGPLIFETKNGLEVLIGNGPNKISTHMDGDAYFIGRIDGKVGYIKLEDGNAKVRISADDAPRELSKLQLIVRRNQNGDIEIVNIGKNKIGVYS